MPVITLLTDFGDRDEYTGVMKGVILSINPAASIVDITHQIDPQNLIQAAAVIESCYRFFPSGTIHVVVVDPDVGRDRDILAVKIKDFKFIAPDNGVLSLVLEKTTPDTVIRVTAAEYFLGRISRTFHGRDIFAPVAAHLSKGVALEALGEQVGHETINRLKLRRPYVSGQNVLIGTVVSSDRFGNLITDIQSDMLEAFCPPEKRRQASIKIAETIIKGVFETYADVPKHQPLAIIGSRGSLEIAVNRGSAQADLAAGPGDRVSISLAEKDR